MTRDGRASPDNAALAARSPPCWRIGPARRRCWPIRGCRRPTTSRCGAPCGWRSCSEGSAAAAAVFAATLAAGCWPIRRQMRDRLLPLVAETLVAGGETAAAAAVARGPQGRRRARSGPRHAAGSDRAISPAALDDLRSAGAVARPVGACPCRGSRRGTAARQRRYRCASRRPTGWIACSMPGAAISANARCANVWPNSRRARAPGVPRLALLRENETLFPDDKAAIHAKLTDMFAALLRNNAASCCAAGAGVAGGGERRSAAYRHRWRGACRPGWPIGCWRWICRSAPDRCWKS